MNNKEIDFLIKEGEGLTVECRERFTSRMSQDIVAFANTKGGRILIGVNDTNKVIGFHLTNVIRAQIISLARNCHPSLPISIKQIGRVAVINIPEGNEKPYSCSDGYYRRLDAASQKMTQNEIKTFFRESVDIFFEELPRKDVSIKEISLSKIKAFLKETQTSLGMNKANRIPFLSSIGAYESGQVNNAGVLMFAENIPRLFPHSETILLAFKGTNKSLIFDRLDVKNDLLTQLQQAEFFLQKHLNIRSEITGFKRDDIHELPMKALREALVNALVHRDYSIRGTSIYVEIYDDRIEISNPGGVPIGLDKRLFGKNISLRRNPIIADLFHRMNLMERSGSGIEKMRNHMREAGLKPPLFELDNFFRITFYREPQYSLKKKVRASIVPFTTRSDCPVSAKMSTWVSADWNGSPVVSDIWT